MLEHAATYFWAWQNSWSLMLRKIEPYSFATLTHVETWQLKATLTGYYSGLRTSLVPEWSYNFPTSFLNPIPLEETLYSFFVPQETRLSLINTNNLYTSTEQTFIKIQQGPVPPPPSFNSHSLETLVQTIITAIKLDCKRAILCN